ncbi:HAD-IA family hydrolase [Shewanella sp. Isolate7]|uniref:HAD family hydrolase n=1 Tax=Shewanella sp. Isolate7 TaxID=2908528 RepID=UPI001EFC89C3|nr:HAD-IA family hydrolase [Shewanella sp. Isolate7]MCG9722706.1 HAD family hydrolase [Shewanella sp. Isolate7]
MQSFDNLFKGVIFDLDGTLVSSSLDFKALKQAVGCPLDQDILTFVRQLPSMRSAEAHKIITRAEHLDAMSAEALTGALALLDFLLLQQIPTAIVTRNSRRAAELKIERCKLPIDLIYSRDDGPAKPDPSCLLALAKAWQLPPQQIAYVGDHHYDVQAAKRAGMPSVLLTAQRSYGEQHGASFIFKDLMALHRALPSISLCA